MKLISHKLKAIYAFKFIYLKIIYNMLNTDGKAKVFIVGHNRLTDASIPSTEDIKTGREKTQCLTIDRIEVK